MSYLERRDCNREGMLIEALVSHRVVIEDPVDALMPLDDFKVEWGRIDGRMC